MHGSNFLGGFRATPTVEGTFSTITSFRAGIAQANVKNYCVNYTFSPNEGRV